MNSKTQLRDDLCRILGWDGEMVDSVLPSIDSSAQNPEAINEIVEGFMGGSAEARRVISAYLRPQQGGQAPPKPFRSKAAPASSSSHSQGAAPATQQDPFFVPPAMSGADAAAASLRNLLGDRVRVAKDSKDKGGPGAKRADRDKEDQPPAAAPRGPEKQACNCLKCGKVYDLKKASSENARFLETGGACGFCGSRVSLRKASQAVGGASGDGYFDASEAHLRHSGGMAEGEAATARATAEAVAFKNRLVEYDRSAAKRTTVIDDQSDFYEVDGNAWLTEVEKSEIRERIRMEEEAREKRKKQVRVTIDLLGRRVIEADEGEDDPSTAGNSAAALAAAEATARETPQGGGAAVLAAGLAALGMHEAEASEAEYHRLRELRAVVCPGIRAPVTFVPSRSAHDAAADPGTTSLGALPLAAMPSRHAGGTGRAGGAESQAKVSVAAVPTARSEPDVQMGRPLDSGRVRKSDNDSNDQDVDAAARGRGLGGPRGPVPGRGQASTTGPGTGHGAGQGGTWGTLGSRSRPVRMRVQDAQESAFDALVV